ncbi:hypothetical protein J6590_027144 [Homalodisca vitripennis]|nr:hypothetical protein J6590_027144 [Homalodisca vitripennis]
MHSVAVAVAWRRRAANLCGHQGANISGRQTGGTCSLVAFPTVRSHDGHGTSPDAGPPHPTRV